MNKATERNVWLNRKPSAREKRLSIYRGERKNKDR